MNAPLIWIGLPVIFAIVSIPFIQRRLLVLFLGVILCFLLALLAWLIPFNNPIRLGTLAFELNSVMEILGRRLVLSNGDRPMLVVAYTFGAFWLAGSQAAGGAKLIVPFGLAIIAVLIASLAVEPFLYAALLIEGAVLLSVPLLTPVQQQSTQGVLRYLVFQSLALPFILLAGWAAAGVDLHVGNPVFLIRAVILLGLGFAFWLGVFPFYTWLPLLAGQSHPYPVGFILMMLPSFVLIFLLGFFDQFAWIRNTPDFLEIVRLIGAVMIITAGFWSAFQNNLGRLLGYGAIIEIGFSLLAISLLNRRGIEAFSMMLLPRLLIFGLLSLSFSVILSKYGSLNLSYLEGSGHQIPFAAAGLATGIFALTGIPLSATFAPRFLVLQELSAESLELTVSVLAGLAGMLFSGLRVIAVVFRRDDSNWATEESWVQVVLLSLGLLFVFIMGLFPNFILPWMTNLVTAFSKLR